MKEEHFLEIFKTIWFFALLFAASQIQKEAKEDRKKGLIFFFCWIIIVIITFSVWLGGCEPEPTQKVTDQYDELPAPETSPEKQIEENKIIEDTTTVYEGVVDASFVYGTWQVIKSDSTIIGEIRFETDATGSVTIASNSSNILNLPQYSKGNRPWLITSSNQQYGRKTELILYKKAKNQMKGILTNTPHEGFTNLSSPTKKNTYEVTFIKKY